MDYINVIVSGVRTPATLEWVTEKFGKDAPAVILEAHVHAALNSVDTQHAALMRTLTGGVTVEERDTWQMKELAARALTDGSATEAQINMLEVEASYLDVSATALTAKIIAKADLFKKLTGLAGGVRGKARAAIKNAKDLKGLSSALEIARDDMQAAITVFAGG